MRKVPPHPMRYDFPVLRRMTWALLVLGAASRAAPDSAWAANPAEAISPSPPRLGGPTPEAVEFFETHIRPVLVEKCYECHSAKAKVLKGKLRLDSAERMRAGGE